MKNRTKEEIYALIAKDELQQAIEILLRELPQNEIAEVILQSARFHDLEKQIRLGLIDYKDQTLTKSQIRYGILELLKTLEGTFQLSVLVAGTGRFDLPKDVYLMAKYLGTDLAKEGMKLICGGWQGVDYVVAEEYAASLQEKGEKLSENLIQVITENSEPIFKGGELIYVKRGIKEWLEAIKYADIVVLIGGEGGTYETYTYAYQEGRAVIPLPSTGGDAKRVYEEIVENQASMPALKNIAKEDFEALDFPLNQDEANAKILSKRVIDLIKKIYV